MSRPPGQVGRGTSDGAFFARGVVVTLMVYGHVSFIGAATDVQEWLYDILHSFRMPVLIFLTGFFLNTQRHGGETARRAVRMVLIPYLIFETLYLVVHTGMNAAGLMRTNTPPISSASEFLRTIALDPTGPFWFLYFLALIQLAVAAAQWVHGRFPSVSMELVLVLLACGLGWGGLVTPDFVIFYLAGVAFRARADDLDGSALAAFAIVVAGLVLGAASMEASYFLRLPFVLGVSFLLVALGARHVESGVCKAFSLIGRNSMSILCWHAFLIAGLRPFSRLFLAIDPTGVLYALTATVLGVTGALLLTRLSDRLGLSNLVFGSHPAYHPLRRNGADRPMRPEPRPSSDRPTPTG